MEAVRRLTKLKLARLERGVRQLDVVFAAHIPQPRLSLLENGYATPRADELDRIASALGVEVALLSDSKGMAA